MAELSDLLDFMAHEISAAKGDDDGEVRVFAIPISEDECVWKISKNGMTLSEGQGDKQALDAEVLKFDPPVVN